VLAEVENIYMILQQIYLFSKPYTIFYQNRPSFIEDIARNMLVSFFQTHCINASWLHECFADKPVCWQEDLLTEWFTVKIFRWQDDEIAAASTGAFIWRGVSKSLFSKTTSCQQNDTVS